MNFNFFKKSPNLKAEQSESSLNNQEFLSQKEDIQPVEAAQPVREEKIEIPSVIKDLKHLLELKRNLGLGVNPEEIEQTAQMKIEDLFTYLNGERIDINASGKELIEVLSESLAIVEQEASSQTVWRKLADNPKLRAAFVALMIFMKFAPAQAQEAGKVDKDVSKQESFASLSVGDSPDVYHPDLSEFYRGEKDVSEKKSAKESDAKPLDIKSEREVLPENVVTKLEMANYFDTDSDKINQEEEIKQSLSNFLSSLKPEQLDNLNNWQFKVTGNSDERLTNNWPEGNYGLTKARLAALSGVLQEIIDNYDFSGWPEDKIETIKAKAKNIIQEPYISATGPEKGTKYITDLLNPETRQNYSQAEAAEIKKNNPDLYKKLLDDCREVSFEIEANEKLSKFINRHSSFVLAGDASGSMVEIAGGPRPTYQYLADIFADQSIDGPKDMQFALFAGQGLIDLKKVNDLQEMSGELKKIDGKGDGRKELALGSAIQILKQEKPKDWRERPDLPALGNNPYLLIATDEDLQDVTYHNVVQLKKIAEEKGAEVKFGYADDQKQKLFQISLKDISDKLEAKKMTVFSDSKVDDLLQSVCSKESLKKMATLAEKKASDVDKLAAAKEASVNTYRERWLAANKHLSQLESGKKTVANLKATERVKAELDKIEDEARGILAEAAAMRQQSEAYRASVKEIKEGAEAYNSHQDKSILLHPYFAELSLGGNDPMAMTISRSEFKEKLDLSKL